MQENLFHSFHQNFLGSSPSWYKKTIVAFLILNVVVYLIPNEQSKFVLGWLLIAEFIFTLAMALKCYPLQPGGMLAIQAVLLGLTTPYHVMDEVTANLEVILLLVFMVAGIHFMRDLLLFTFTKILLNVRSKSLLSVLFCVSAALLSAFLDALTVTAVLISVAVGFFSVYHKVASGKKFDDFHDHTNDASVQEANIEDLNQFRSFLRSLIMHGAVGTALGGVCTLVGEPQNLLISEKVGWEFIDFIYAMAPITVPTFIVGLLTCVLMEKLKWFCYGAKLPKGVRSVLKDFSAEQDKKRTKADTANLIVQAIIAIILVASLALHVASVGLIGLMIIVLLTTFTGVIEEHKIGHAFEEALPFTALLVVFFAIVAVIHDQHLFEPVTTWVLGLPTDAQPVTLFAANGVLSMISDNVFVATVYINEVAAAFANGSISREHYETLAVAINTGTNLPSVATPNGQAAFLFLLTSALAPLIGLSYMRMLVMAIPYTVALSVTGILAIFINF